MKAFVYCNECVFYDMCENKAEVYYEGCYYGTFDDSGEVGYPEVNCLEEEVK